MLPPELQNKIKYYVIEHPLARIIKDEVERLNCNLTFKFRNKQGHLICKIRGIDFFCNEFFRQLNDECSSSSSDDDLFNSMFEVSDTSSDDDD